MPEYKGKVFTYAANNANRPVDLLFHDLDNWDLDNVKEETLLDIARDPVTREVLGPYFVVVPQDKWILASSSETTLLAHLLEDPKFEHPIVVNREDYQTVHKTVDIYNGCELPDKYVFGCSECIFKRIDNPCVFKQILINVKGERIIGRKLRETWKPSKTTLAGYTLVSPTLTSWEHITQHFRDKRLHNFEEVQNNSDSRSSAAKEKHRHVQFKKNVCGECCVKDGCWEVGQFQSQEYTIRHCKGNYVGTQIQLAKKILKKVTIPFTDRQLSFLLANSGPTDKRYARKKWWFTLITGVEGELLFVMRREVHPGTFTDKLLSTFDEAKEMIESLKERVLTPDPYKLKPLEKATLIELGYRDTSPCRRSIWHQTTYPLLGIKFDTYARTFKTFYRYSRMSTTLPWSAQVDDLSEIYKLFGNLRFVHKNPRPDFYNVRYHNI